MPKVRQPSRKTKSAWRKNIDLEDVEASLENARAAERLGLAPITSTTHSSALFVEDRKGDEELKKKLKAGKKPLKSLAILREKDEGTVPVIGRARRGVADAVVNRRNKDSSQNGLTPEQRALRNGMSKKDIEKLRRLTGRDVKGAFGAIVEEEDEESHTKNSGPQAIIGEENYDVWRPDQDSSSSTATTEDPTLRSKPRKAPRTLLEVRTKDVHLPLPEPGQSYNPTAEAHESLLDKALQNAQAEEMTRQIESEYKQKWDQGAKAHLLTAKDGVERLLGMQVSSQEAGEMEDESEEESEEVPTKKLAKRKTKQQRAKAKKLKEEIRAREQVKAGKRTKSQLQQLRILHKQLNELEEEKSTKAIQREELRKRKSEEKVGMYKLPKLEKEVQLGEDLSESLRGLKPEGNLLKDRIHAFQKRGLIEPKKQNVMKNNSKGITRRQKEYERHSYKRFT